MYDTTRATQTISLQVLLIVKLEQFRSDGEGQIKRNIPSRIYFEEKSQRQCKYVIYDPEYICSLIENKQDLSDTCSLRSTRTFLSKKYASRCFFFFLEVEKIDWLINSFLFSLFPRISFLRQEYVEEERKRTFPITDNMQPRLAEFRTYRRVTCTKANKKERKTERGLEDIWWEHRERTAFVVCCKRKPVKSLDSLYCRLKVVKLIPERLAPVVSRTNEKTQASREEKWKAWCFQFPLVFPLSRKVKKTLTQITWRIPLPSDDEESIDPCPG